MKLKHCCKAKLQCLQSVKQPLANNRSGGKMKSVLEEIDRLLTLDADVIDNEYMNLGSRTPLLTKPDLFVTGRSMSRIRRRSLRPS